MDANWGQVNWAQCFATSHVQVGSSFELVVVQGPRFGRKYFFLKPLDLYKVLCSFLNRSRIIFLRNSVP